MLNYSFFFSISDLTVLSLLSCVQPQHTVLFVLRFCWLSYRGIIAVYPFYFFLPFRISSLCFPLCSAVWRIQRKIAWGVLLMDFLIGILIYKNPSECWRNTAKYTWPWQTSGCQETMPNSCISAWHTAIADGAPRSWQGLYCLDEDHCSMFK